jgi:hypothetical protein
MKKLFPTKTKNFYAIRLRDGDLFTYDDGKIAMGSRGYLNRLIETVSYDFSDAKIVEVKPAQTRVKNKTKGYNINTNNN